MKTKSLLWAGLQGTLDCKTQLDPQTFDLPAMHIYKIWGGQIHEIEAMGFTTGYNLPTGWE